MATSLAAEFEVTRHVVIKGDDGLGGERPVFGGAKRQNVHACLPGDLGCTATEMGDGIGDPRAVHM